MGSFATSLVSRFSFFQHHSRFGDASADLARNLKDIKYLSVKSVNALDLLRHQKLIISKDALAQLEKNYI